MADDIKRIHVHYVTFAGTRGQLTFTPSVQGDTRRLKQDIAKRLDTIKDDLDGEYYYVTIEKEGPDGKPRYATVVKKTFFKE